MKIRNKNDLEKLLKKVAKKALETEVAKTAEEVMKDKIDSEVYDVYTPTEYNRTFKLRESSKTKMIDDTALELYNDRFDEDEQISPETMLYHDSGRYIPSVIESGKGYEWVEDEKIGARPFGAETYKELKDDKFKKALIKGIEKQGIKVDK